MTRTTKQLSEREAIAIGIGLPISRKASLEISNFIKGKDVQRAKKMLEDVILMKIAVPCRKIASVGHKKGIGPGNYPIKAATFILNVLKSAEANANSKGLNTDSLIIKTMIPNQGSRSYHYGRRRGLKTKSTHIEIVVEEITKKDDKKIAKKGTTEKKTETTVEKKVEEKTETPKTESKDSESQAEPKKTESKESEQKKPSDTTKVETKPVKKTEEKTEAPKDQAEEIKK
ncbi:50S ribosomal protein L22 [Candidatus Woesearchaeota archaeon]|jgi:large subunit ribosomal protein L22|nr:50S ribosomal protein L22 [Candidatus Woesearchaeota archaeon]MBT4368716.1 50S ribosomal protein L22 [Candidatus Woesearchaeota archaeon]MBT4712005.1 50S ribosomal protein L22 [Candidatus Woesearchaeota archaeon]MBT6638900.1 50S ribosomal protein L22 [Candidatus Woesearchaeota archaeon]MBT7134544.1 50S ribosomal protein L22 [Candidatus Woesearchaeota archaeon]